MQRDTPNLANRISLIACVLGAALVIQPAVEFGSGLLVFVIVVLLAGAAASAVALIARSKN